MKAPLPPGEIERLRTLHDYAVLDTPPEPDFDDIATLAAQICAVPIALITLVDEKRQWFKSRMGMEERETPRELAFCAHAILEPARILEIFDATRDERFADNPFVKGEPGIRFYAGAPLVASGGQALGTLCVLDRVPRELTVGQRQALATLSRQVMVQLELRRELVERRKAADRAEEKEAFLRMAARVARFGAWLVDLAENRTIWSDEVRAIHEVGPEYNPTVEDGIKFYAPERRAEIRAAFAACAREGHPFDLELPLLTARGRQAWVRAVGEAVRGPGGDIVQVRGAFQDITERKQAAEEARRMADRMVTTLENITDAFLTIDRDWRFTFLNREAERLLDRPQEDLLGRPIWSEFPEAIGSTFDVQYRLALAENRTVTFEEHYAPLRRWFSVRAYPSPEGLAVYFQDVTELRAAREALRASEQRLREMADSIGDIFYDYDAVNDRLLYANAVYEEIWGRPLPELLARPSAYLDHVHPEDRAAAEEAFRKQLAGSRTEVEFRVIRPDGGIRWVLERAVPIGRGADGKIERIVGTIRDITARREAEVQLRESEERFRLLARATLDAVWDWNLMTDEVWWNEGYETLFGHRRDEVERSSRSWSDFIHPEDLKRVSDAIHAVIDGGGTEWSDEYRFRRKDGSYVDVADRGQVIRDPAGRAVRMIGGMTDLTERREAERRLREQAELLDKAQDAILVRDLGHRINYWNKSAERLYGWTAEEVRGRSVRELLYFDPGIFDAAMQRLLAEGEWTGELAQLGRDGRQLQVEGHWTLLRDEAGRPTSVLAINTDITERKKLEQQFLRAQRMESIGTLAGGIAHDLNNLLAPITMGVELLRRNEPSPRSQQIIESIERSARRGADLVKQVLSFARGVEGSRVPLQIRHVIREIESIVANSFPKNIVFEARVPPDLWLILGDPTQISQVLLNLCVNARDALPDGGRLSLQASNIEVDEQYAVMNRGVAAGRYVVIEVADNGSGMPPEIIDRIFEPFFTTKEHGKGTGLGLSTVLGIVRSHGGFVNVYSEPRKGSNFKVYLPAHADAPPLGSATPFEVKFPRGAGELILVVDDEASIRQVTQQTLEAFGYKVVTAEDGAQAIGVYATHRPEVALVLTDMMMPIMDGPALIAALRRIDPQVRIIAASGLNANGNVARAAHAGVKHFLPKPYSADAMLGLIRRVLTEGASRPPA